jgi:hypothetical protein
VASDLLSVVPVDAALRMIATHDPSCRCGKVPVSLDEFVELPEHRQRMILEAVQKTLQAMHAQSFAALAKVRAPGAVWGDVLMPSLEPSLGMAHGGTEKTDCYPCDHELRQSSIAPGAV